VISEEHDAFVRSIFARWGQANPPRLRVVPGGAVSKTPASDRGGKGGVHARKPLVYAAAGAVKQSHELLAPGVVLECAVERAIAGGLVSHDPRREGDVAVVTLGDAIVAVVKRTRSPLSGRRAWLVTAVRRDIHEEGRNR
jgi:hypothetical protein